MSKKPRLCLDNSSWRRIAPEIPDIRRCRGFGDRGARRFVEAVIWIWRTGAPWRDLPGYFGKWFTAYKRFRRWALGGAWQTIHQVLRRNRTSPARTISIDSTTIRVHQHAAGAQGGAPQNAIGRSRGGRTTKLHTAVSDDKTLLAQILTEGQRADITQAAQLVDRLPARPARIVADRAYDADAFIAWLAQPGIDAVIPPRKHRNRPRSWDRHAYAERNVVERFYLHAKQFRRLASRFDKTASSYQAGVLLVDACYLAV